MPLDYRRIGVFDEGKMLFEAKAPQSTSAARRGGRLPKALLFAAKFAVTGICLWYAFRQVHFIEPLGAFNPGQLGWVVVAILLVVLETVLAGVRWHEIIHALDLQAGRLTSGTAIAISMIASFFSQIVPSLAGEGIRIWLIVRQGYDLKNAALSVIIDRAVGVAAMAVFVCGILLLPSSLAVLAGYRMAIFAAYGTALLCGMMGLAFLPWIAPLLERSRYLRWIATLAAATRRVPAGRPQRFHHRHLLLYPCAHDRHHLAARARSDSGTDTARRRGAVHGDPRHFAHTDHDRRLGASRAGSGVAPRESWDCARAGPALLRVVRTRDHRGIPSGRDRLALVARSSARRAANLVTQFLKKYQRAGLEKLGAALSS